MNERTIQQMKELRLHGMHRAFETTLGHNGMGADYTNDEIIAYPVQCEWDDRHNRRIERLTRPARFRYTAVMEGVGCRPSRQLDRHQGPRIGKCGANKKTAHALIPGR